MNLKVEEDKLGGKVYLHTAQKPKAEMTFSKSASDLIIEHTWVHKELRGQGAAREMLSLLVAKARKEQKKIVPVCSYAQGVFEKEQSIRDVLKA